MESSEESGCHKPSIAPLVINPALSTSSDDVDVVFSEDYIDSPQSSDIKSPLDMSGDGSGDCQSDELSSLGTIEADEDVNNGTQERTQSDLNLPLVPSSSVNEPGSLAYHNNSESECQISLLFLLCSNNRFSGKPGITGYVLFFPSLAIVLI